MKNDQLSYQYQDRLGTHIAKLQSVENGRRFLQERRCGMDDPVVAKDGHTYEREAIEAFIR